ncbi:hypothetical protein DNK47_02040 [Mycoplasma wenyonii]|uniref:Uncharacterized protein n=1 Tax=Mycoplasma wenyonii TaxID=65123 RepID=A0A328PJP3_9MOLU|nr:hypothetical protein [Mycoplasma wenyonii]RAO95042.1 hypothetical protein DNK47_02040 [Mycoplasma wenyonii]
MSFLIKTLQGFSGLGVISIIPLSLASDKKEQPIRIFRTGGGTQNQNIKKLLEEKGETGYDGCVALGGLRANAVLFVCAKTETPNKPVFYHYDWSLRNSDTKERLNKVKSLTHKYSYSAQMQLDNGTSKNLLTPPHWLSKWGSDKEFLPDQHCEISKPQGAGNYKLICKVPDNGSQPPAWEQDL